ncbi:hypothetical protein [Saccharothrix syringae]|uniref:Uncharacterized protein n=1 Tax=Saccharothrix syringae TaxID=103733 RepID=A0A5Q0H019_SACSY|nr:hypothetical protein [Saccharothrix syringae]QFZ19453.1 hypothetical protein EKG83_20200 [Saccharothrix syringae]
MTVPDREHHRRAPRRTPPPPAAPHLTGLHALQRLAGNAAVTSIVQRTWAVADAKRVPAEEARAAGQAVERHRGYRRRVLDVLEEGAAIPERATNDDYDRRWRNTARWLLQGTSPLFVLSRPHDHEHRRLDPHQGEMWLKSAVRPDVEPAADYELHPRHGGLARVVVGGVPAFVRGGLIHLVDGDRTREEVVKFLVHEVQHLADGNGEWDRLDHTSRDHGLDEAWQIYATEYRAHSYQARDEFPDDERPAAELDGFRTARQLAIFRDIHGGSAYPQVTAAWDGEEGQARQPFRDRVRGHVEPESLNPLNSPALHEFHRSFRYSTTPWETFRATFDRLDRRDTAALRDSLATHPLLLERLGEFLARHAPGSPGIREAVRAKEEANRSAWAAEQDDEDARDRRFTAVRDRARAAERAERERDLRLREEREARWQERRAGRSPQPVSQEEEEERRRRIEARRRERDAPGKVREQ